MIQYSRAISLYDLEKIKDLQNRNLRSHPEVKGHEDQGFLTAQYSLSFLNKMNKASPAIIAYSENILAGYALVAVKSIRKEHPLLEDLFNRIDQTHYKQIPLSQSNYVVVGQLCVDKAFRGQGIASNLYSFFKDCLSAKFEYCITDVHQTNTASMKTHLKTGFQIIGQLEFEENPFNMVLWDWNRP
jgi:GNAT superfamily N-acetyltransferase